MKGLEEVLQIDLYAERAKRDSSYNNVVIEFKAPTSFKGSAKSTKFVEATEGRLFLEILKSLLLWIHLFSLSINSMLNKIKIKIKVRISALTSAYKHAENYNVI
jgi:hypothetical protein